MRILLDTCTFLWIAAGSSQLSKACLEAFRTPANEVFLSPVSAWEIAVKYDLGKLELSEPPERLVPAERRRHAIGSLPLDERSTLMLRRLPPLHRDPFDRMLVCQALVHGLTILTPDEQIERYAVSTLW